MTRIVDDRIKILNINKTKAYYTYCPPNKPYHDGIACINCPNEYNIDIRRCVTSLNKTTAYDENMRCYLQKESGK